MAYANIRRMFNVKSNKESPLILLTFLAAALRFFALGKESLWFDEAYSWQIASQSLHTALTAEVNNPPLYYVLLHYWISIFGTSEIALRSLSACFGVATTVVLYFLAVKLFERRVAFWPTLLFVLSPFQIYYAQEARAFALLTFLLLSSTFVLWKLVTEPPNTLRQLLYAGLLTVALYTHFISIFFIAAQGLYILVHFKLQRRFWQILGPQILAVLFFSPWLVQMLAAASGGGQHRRYLILKFPQAIFSFLFGDTLIPLDEAAVSQMKETLLNNGITLVLGMLSLLTLAFYFSKCLRRDYRSGHGFLLMQALVPFVLAFLVSFKIMLFDERYLIFSGLLMLVLVGIAIAEVVRNRNTAGRVAIGVYFGLMGLALFNYFFHPRFGREQWREVVQIIEQQAGDNDLVLFDVGYLDIPYQYYQKRPLARLRALENYVEPLPEQFSWQATIETVPQVWLVRAHYENDRVLDVLEESLTVVDRYIFPKAKQIEVYKLERKADVLADTTNLQ